MRYRETGNVHKDFHLATDTTIKYVLKRYGVDFLYKLFKRTAQKVYKEIYDALKQGDTKPLLEHTDYFLKRENADFTIDESNNEIVITVNDCPAVRHLKESGVSPTTDFCLQTAFMNEAWSENTPFDIRTIVTGEGSCIQIIRRKDASK